MLVNLSDGDADMPLGATHVDDFAPSCQGGPGVACRKVLRGLALVRCERLHG